MAKSWPVKDPEEVLDYGFDYSERMTDGDFIVSQTAVVTTGDVEIDDSFVNPSGKAVTVWLSGGTDSTDCEINLHAETQAGREFEQIVKIKIKTRY